MGRVYNSKFTAQTLEINSEEEVEVASHLFGSRMEKKRKHVQSSSESLSPSSKKSISDPMEAVVQEINNDSANASQHLDDLNEENAVDDEDYEDVIEDVDQINQPIEEEEEEEEKKSKEEPLKELMENFSKELLVSLMAEYAEKHTEMGERVRLEADKAISSRKVFVFGIGSDSNTEILTDAFKQYGEIVQCRALKKSKGYGFVVFKSRREALHALQSPFKMIANRVASCRLALSSDVNISNQSRSDRKIHVGNLSSAIDPIQLAQHFSQFGEIEEGPLGLSEEGRLKSFCFIIYKTVLGAKRALKKSRRKFQGRVLHCRRADGPKKTTKSVVGNSKSDLPVRHVYPQPLGRYVPVHHSSDIRFPSGSYTFPYVREHPPVGRDLIPVRGSRSLYEFGNARSHGGGYSSPRRTRGEDSLYYGRY